MEMLHEVEVSTLDLRYESYRMRSSAQERRMLSSIAERGIEEPLEGVTKGQCNILLNGFKRYRCARKLHIGVVPYTTIGEEEALGIVGLLRISNNKSLSILEQARFIDDLKNLHGLTATAIASELGRSKSWVSMRLGLIGEMSAVVREKIFNGSFPVYPYMYTLRQFMRMNSVSKKDVEEFVMALSGKNLSVREIERLAQGYFQGPASFREELLKGNVSLPLERLAKVPEETAGLNKFERVFLNDLLIVQKYMQRLMGKSRDRRLKNRAFHAQSNLLIEGIQSRTSAFLEAMRERHDRSGET
jgi:predicted transcriptional regulator